MNKLSLLFGFVSCLLLTIGCEEIPPEITPCQTNRVVLVEEFTGIDCVNCPTGSEKLELISAQNPGKVLVVGIHAGFFATDHNGFDLRCPDGLALEQYLGPVQGYPAATINRKIFVGENQLPLGAGQWAGLINNEICQPPIAELAITTTYNETDSMASVVVDISKGLFFNENLTHDLALTILITESNIIGYQKTPDGTELSYVHKHVLRDVVSSDAKGDVIISKGNPITTQQTVINNYKIPAEWNPENCHVVAFVHNKGANLEIHQAIEKHLTN
jgi:thiol-disulfide isomerase/thioredoxin